MHPFTAVLFTERFIAAYNAMAANGADDVLSIHIPESLSAVSKVARVAAQETSSTRVTLLDSGHLSLGTGFLVEKSAEMAAAGSSITEIVPVLEDPGKRS